MEGTIKTPKCSVVGQNERKYLMLSQFIYSNLAEVPRQIARMLDCIDRECRWVQQARALKTLDEVGSLSNF
jgi:hypothetical protein